MMMSWKMGLRGRLLTICMKLSGIHLLPLIIISLFYNSRRLEDLLLNEGIIISLYVNHEIFITPSLQDPSFPMRFLRVGDVVCAAKQTILSSLISLLGLLCCGGRIHYRLGQAPLYIDKGKAYANNS